MADQTILTLTNDEWISVIDQTDEGLPYCCANISALRDDLIQACRYGRDQPIMMPTILLRSLFWCYSSHDMETIPVMKKIKDQILAVPENKEYWDRLNKHEDARTEEV